MKIRLSTIIIMIFAVAAGLVLFQTSQNVQRAEDRLHKMQEALVREKESVRVLEAEWDYLNRPDRLEDLARQHLKIQLPSPESLVGNRIQLPDPGMPIIPPRKPAFVAQPAVMKTVDESAIQTPPPPSPPPAGDTGQQFHDLLDTLTGETPAAGGVE